MFAISKQIATIIDLKGKSKIEKIHRISQLARNIQESIPQKMNNIDDGKELG